MSNHRLNIVPIGSSQSLKVRAYDALRSAITNMNIYALDAELRLDERDLSARFGVSRTPLREALAQLDHEGLIRVVARRGNFIVRKSKAEILDMITVWAALESMAARMAAKVASDSEISALRGLVAPYAPNEILAHMGEYSDANIQFHRAIIRLSGCTLIGETTDGLLHHVRAIRHRAMGDIHRAHRSLGDHADIITALEKRDADHAGHLVREHTLRLRDHVERFVDLE